MALPSAQIAEDFRDALEDLSTNDRHQIQTLAGLANENSEHALAISREIEKHIRGATPGKKLPALYLLDSLVKNYGKPYSDILSRNLFTIFMEAYQRVDDNVRRSMEALAKTWKVPVANSGDTKPVFPPDVTRQIDLALGQARAAYATQQSRTPQPPFAPPRPPNMGGPWGHTATPPQHDLRFQPPATYGQAYGAAPGFPPQPPQQAQQYASNGFPPNVSSSTTQASLDTMWMSDLDSLVSEAQSGLAINPHDRELSHKLQALQQLQTILRTQQLSPEDRRRIRDQVEQLKQQSRSRTYVAYQTHQPTAPPSLPPAPSQYSFSSSVPLPPHGSSQPGLPPSIAHFLGQSQLAYSAAHSSTPPPPLAPPFVPPPTSVPVPSSSAAPNSVIDALRAAGILMDGGGPARPSSANMLAPGLAPSPATASFTGTPPVLSLVPGRSPLSELQNDVQLTTASLRKPRPRLIESLYSKQPNQCITCGRRFGADEEGRAQKARHLDWHFRVNVKLSEASRRGTTRSWYLKEIDFVRFREIDDSAESPSAQGHADKQAEESTASQVQYIRAPTDSTLSKQPCPICQESFKTSWHEEAQEWVWMDAVQVGGRIYHGTCREDMTKGRSSPQVAGKMYTPSPDSVLGKRRNEGNGEMDKRVKREMLTA